MKVLLKSLEELKYEYGTKAFDSFVVLDNLINLFGKIVEAKYDKVSDSYVVDGWYFHPNLIKGVVIKEETKYTIKRLSDGVEYDFIVVK